MIESPSERSARMTLFADLSAGKPLIAVAPVAALRQYVIPPEVFKALAFDLRPGTGLRVRRAAGGVVPTGLPAQRRRPRRPGEYAVRGGIVDARPRPRQRRCASILRRRDRSIRAFDLATQRSNEKSRKPWPSHPGARSPETRNCANGSPRRRPNARDDLCRPRPDRPAAPTFPRPGCRWPSTPTPTLLDHLDPDALLVLEEPAMLANRWDGAWKTSIRARNRCCSPRWSRGTLGRRGCRRRSAAGRRAAAPHPRLDDLAGAIARLRTLIVPGAIEGPAPWLPRVLDSFVLETRPAEHFNRQISLFLERTRELVEGRRNRRPGSAAARRD